MKKNALKYAAASACILALTGATSTVADDGTTWRSYGQNPGATNFSPLTQINAENVHQLKRAWTWRYGGGDDNEGDRGLDHRWEVTPLVIDGVMYFSTPTNPNKPELKSTITAMQPETGEVLWQWESERNIHGRGIAYWPGDATHGPRILFATDKGYLAALDIRAKQLATDFG